MCLPLQFWLDEAPETLPDPDPSRPVDLLLDEALLNSQYYIDTGENWGLIAAIFFRMGQHYSLAKITEIRSILEKQLQSAKLILPADPSTELVQLTETQILSAILRRLEDL